MTLRFTFYYLDNDFKSHPATKQMLIISTALNFMHLQ